MKTREGNEFVECGLFEGQVASPTTGLRRFPAPRRKNLRLRLGASRLISARSVSNPRCRRATEPPNAHPLARPFTHGAYNKHFLKGISHYGGKRTFEKCFIRVLLPCSTGCCLRYNEIGASISRLDTVFLHRTVQGMPATKTLESALTFS